MYFVQVIPTHEDVGRLEHGINRVNEHSASHLRQTIDDVAASMEKGHAQWFVVRDDKTILADLIVKTLLEDERRTLYVWLMFGSNMRKWAPFAMAALEDLARFNRCDNVKFHTSRPEWIRMLPDVGQQWEHTHVFRRKVSYGRTE